MMCVCSPTHPLQIMSLEKKKRAAAKTMNKAKISNAIKAIEEYEQSKSKFDCTLLEFKEKLQGTYHKLQLVEESLRRLKPSMKLDTLEDRCK